ncbi:hypothetical protein EAF00_008357 [Botryotinia globosa]|nr:hypothetical protein EAF00_008357 [Botryotinia globosa]
MRFREDTRTESNGNAPGSDCSASRNRGSKETATDCTKTGTPKASPSNPPASNSLKFSHRFITSTPNSRIHPTTGTLTITKPSPGSFPNPKELPAASSSKRPNPPPTGSTHIRHVNSSSPRPTRPLATSASTSNPPNSTTVATGPSNSTGGSESKPKTDQELYKQDANGLYYCKKGCVDKPFMNPDNRKRHYDERHSGKRPELPCPLGKDCIDVVFSRRENLNRHLTSKRHKEAQAKRDQNR